MSEDGAKKYWYKPLLGFEEDSEIGDSTVLRVHYGLDEDGVWQTQIITKKDGRLASVFVSGRLSIRIEGDVPLTDPSFAPVPDWMTSEPIHKIDRLIPGDSELVSVTYDSMVEKQSFLDVVLKNNGTILAIRFHRPFWCEFLGFVDFLHYRPPSVHDVSAHHWEDVGIFVAGHYCTDGFYFLCRTAEVLYTDSPETS